MSICYDTNILITLARDPSGRTQQLVNPTNEFQAVSLVTVAEARSLALQNNWGASKINALSQLLADFNILDINDPLILARYVDIDAFSQARHPQYARSFSPRNMGKNDLWIAATASVLNLRLVTTDKDFDHLNGIFNQVQRFTQEQLRL